MAKIATALNVEVYQLFIPQNITNIDITPTPENENIRAQIQKQVVENVKKALLKELNKLEK